MTQGNLFLVSKKTGDSSVFQSCKPTGFHQHGRGRLVDDGAYFGERCEAAVVRPAVVLHGVREVQVAVEARGNPLVLLDVLEIWGGTEWKERGISWFLGRTARPRCESSHLKWFSEKKKETRHDAAAAT